MIQRIDDLLWDWGTWARSLRLDNGSRGLVMAYEERTGGVTNLDETAALQIDQLLAQMPDYMNKHRRAVKRKYFFSWPDTASSQDMNISRSTFKHHIDLAHYWLDGRLFRHDSKVHGKCKNTT